VSLKWFCKTEVVVERTEQDPWWDRVAYGPLMVLPFGARLPTYRAVMRGQAIGDPDLVHPAARFAHLQVWIFGSLAAVALLVVVAAVVGVVLDPTPGDLSGVLGLWLGAQYGRNWTRARRSLRAMGQRA